MNTNRCRACGKSLQHKGSRALYCDSTCRANGAKRRAKGVPESVVTELPAAFVLEIVGEDQAPEPRLGPVAAATLRELQEAERADTALGQSALALARRIDMGIDTGSALASAAARHAELLAAATRGSRRQETELDRLRRQRDEKRHA